jgi:hypothetical protein
LAVSPRSQWARSAPTVRREEKPDQFRTHDKRGQRDPEPTSVPLKPCSLASWSAQHDNDWVTIVCEQPDGTFAVIVAPTTARGVTPDAVAATPEAGRSAAVEALQAKSGHQQCVHDSR